MRKLGLTLALIVLAVFAFTIPFLWSPRVIRPDLDVADSQTSPNKRMQIEIAATGWNRFRGPNGTGVFKGESPPLAWSDEKNLAWQTELPGAGSSSPVLSDSFVFVTSYDFERKDTGQLAWLKRHVVCVDRKSGRVVWTKTIDGVLPEDPFIGNGLPEHGYATSTPVVGEDRLYAFLGKSGVYCFDFGGNLLWHREVGRKSNPKGWGSCSSPILCGDLLLVNAAEETNALIAFDSQTGEERWRAASPNLNFAFSTPALVRTAEGSVELVLALVGEVWGLNPANGKLLWYVKTPIQGNVSPCVIVDGGLVFVYGGYRGVGSLCIEAGGRGDVTESHLKWLSKLTSYIATPVLIDQRLFWIDEKARYFCQDARNGELISKGRLPVRLTGGQSVYASAVAVAEDKILIQTRHDGVLVLEATEDMALVQQNVLSDEATRNATPAVGQGQLFLRSDAMLHCISL